MLGPGQQRPQAAPSPRAQRRAGNNVAVVSRAPGCGGRTPGRHGVLILSVPRADRQPRGEGLRVCTHTPTRRVHPGFP